jgi:hypothetical protein
LFKYMVSFFFFFNVCITYQPPLVQTLAPLWAVISNSKNFLYALCFTTHFTLIQPLLILRFRMNGDFMGVQVGLVGICFPTVITLERLLPCLLVCMFL